VTWLRLSFESRLDEIFLVSLVVNGVCQKKGLDEITAYQIELCAVEAVTNAIRHAYSLEAGKEVTVLFRFDRDRIDLEIQDHGNPMSMQTRERLMNGSRVLDFDPADIQSLPESGMGLQIIHEIMDEVAYTSDGTGNRLCLTKIVTHDQKVTH